MALCWFLVRGLATVCSGAQSTRVLLDADAAKAALAAQGCGEKGEGGVVRGGD